MTNHSKAAETWLYKADNLGILTAWQRAIVYIVAAFIHSIFELADSIRQQGK